MTRALALALLLAPVHALAGAQREVILLELGARAAHVQRDRERVAQVAVDARIERVVTEVRERRDGDAEVVRPRYCERAHGVARAVADHTAFGSGAK